MAADLVEPFRPYDLPGVAPTDDTPRWHTFWSPGRHRTHIGDTVGLMRPSVCTECRALMATLAPRALTPTAGHLPVVEPVTDAGPLAAGLLLSIRCDTCHSPDGDGVGNASTLTADTPSAADWWAEHVACPATGDPCAMRRRGDGSHVCADCRRTAS